MGRPIARRVRGEVEKMATCRQCGETIPDSHVQKIRAARVRRGMTDSEPKLCIGCFVTIVLNWPMSESDDEDAPVPSGTSGPSGER